VVPDQQVIRDVRALVERGAGIEDVLRHLRAAGLRQIESIKVLRTVYGMSLREADDTVLHSETWADERETTLRLRDSFWTAATEFADDVKSYPDGGVELAFDLRRHDEN
jgi:hypothetical protein